MSAAGITAEQRQDLIAASQEARKLSYSPYSKFRVGAALLSQKGEIILGANVENASYGGAICAERTAIVKAITSGHYKPGSLIAIAVSADLDSSVSPCGICRQVIREFFSLDTPIYMSHTSWTKENDKEDSTIVTRTLDQLLPMSFGPVDLQRPRS